MAKQQTTQNKELEELVKLSTIELKALDLEVRQAGGEDKWLIGKGAIKFNKGRMIVRQDPETGEFPYTTLQEKLKQLNDWHARRQSAEDHEVFMATGVNPRQERMKKILEGTRSIIKSNPVNHE